MPEHLARSVRTLAPDRRLRIELAADPALLPPPHSHDLAETTAIECSATAVTLRSDWFRARLDPAGGGAGQLLVHPAGRAYFGGVLENVLRVLVAYDALHRGGVLLHSSALVRGGRAAVLFGHSGAGKSTAAGLGQAAGCEVLSDDINVLIPVTGTWQAYAVPFGVVGAAGERNEPVPLGGLYRLVQAGRDAAVVCTPARAVALLAASAAFVNQDAYRAEALLDTLLELAQRHPVHELHFTRTARFLDRVLPGPGPVEG